MKEEYEPTASPETAKGGQRVSSHATRTLLVLTGVALLVNYVETMVIPGIPQIQKDLVTTASIASWITAAYLMVGSSVSLLFGKLGDIYGKKKMFLISLTFYITGVVIAGFSPSIFFLLFARALQGIGFAIIPLSLAILTDVFPREDCYRTRDNQRDVCNRRCWRVGCRFLRGTGSWLSVCVSHCSRP